MNYKSVIISGLSWQAGSVLLSAICQLVTLTVLGRILSPADFGDFAICGILVGFANMFSEAGLGPALVQKKDLNERQIGGVFYMSIGFGVIVTIAVFFLSPFYGGFFGSARVTEITKWLSLSFLISSFGVVSQSLLMRELRFKTLSKVETSRAVFASLVAVIAAWQGCGIWAIVLSNISANIFYVSVLQFVRRPKLGRFVGFKEMMPLLRYGAHLTSARFFNKISQSADFFIIGKFLGAGQLGFYERSFKVMQMPAIMLGNVLNRVGFPIMSEIQDDYKRLRSGFFKAVKIGYTIQIPLCLCMAIQADELIYCLLGEGWEDSIIPLQILLLTIPMRILSRLGDALCRAKGAVSSMAKRKFVFAVAVVAGSLIGLRWGVVGVSVGVAVAVSINYLLIVKLCHLVLKEERGFVTQLKALKLGAILGAAVLLVFGGATILMRIADLPAWEILLINGSVVVLSAVAGQLKFKLFKI